jgi:5-formyltetrahydrofolate cyclo-ligase
VTPAGKAYWRELVLRRRRQVDPSARAFEAELLANGAVAACAPVPAGPVCAYVPVGGEPGSLAMLDAMRAGGREVLLPVVPGAGPAVVGPPGPAMSPSRLAVVGPSGPAMPPSGLAMPPPGPLGWALYLGADSLVPGPLGLRQPAGPDLGPAAITDAALVLVPALAVDRRGVRLGRGGGWYDRTLPLARPGTPLLAVVRDDEVFDVLPRDPHDVPVTAVLTPHGGPRPLP